MGSTLFSEGVIIIIIIITTIRPSRVKDAHAHICVGAQTGLGAGVLCSVSINIGLATTVTHRTEKQRLLECFIMEHLLTATERFQQRRRQEHQHLHVQQLRMPRTTAD